MGYMHIDRKRKIFCYQLLKRGVPHSVIQYRVREQFGHQHGEIASSTLSKIKRVGDLTGDPTYVSKIVRLLGMTQALSNPAPIARYPWYTLIDPSHLPSYGQASLDL